MKSTLFFIILVLLAFEILFSFSMNITGLSLKNIAIYPILIILMISDFATGKTKNKKIPALGTLIIMLLFICIGIFYSQIALKTSIGINKQLSTFKSLFFDNFILFIITFLLIDNLKSAKCYLRVVVSIFLVLNMISLIALKLGLNLFTIQQNVEDYERFSGMLANANQMAYFLSFLIPFLYYFYKTDQNSMLKMFFLLGIVGSFISITLSGSRGGILAFFLVMCLISLFAKDFKISFLFLGVSFVFILLALVCDNDLIQRTLERLSRLGQKDIQDASIAGRITIWRGLYDIFISSPFNIIIGTGFGTSRYTLAEKIGMKAGSHNIYLQVLVELGLIGFMIFISLLCNIYKFIRNLKLDELSLFRKATLISFSVILFGWMFSDLQSILRFVAIVSATSLSFLYHGQSSNEREFEDTRHVHKTLSV